MFYFFHFWIRIKIMPRNHKRSGMVCENMHLILWHDMVPLDCVHFMYFQIIGIVISIMTYSTYLHHLFNYLHVSLTIKNEKLKKDNYKEIKTKNFINCLSLKKTGMVTTCTVYSYHQLSLKFSTFLKPQHVQQQQQASHATMVTRPCDHSLTLSQASCFHLF